MIIDQNVLAEAIQKIVPALGEKGEKYILRTIYMSYAKGVLTLRGTNENIDITTKVEAEGTDTFELCIDPMLAKIVGNFEPESIEIKKESRLKVSQGKRVHNVSYVPSKDFPKPFIVEGYGSVDMPTLLHSLRLASTAYARDDSRPVLRCLLVYPGESYLGSADGVSQFVIFNSLTLAGDTDSLVPVPAKSLEAIVPCIKEMYGEVECVFGGNLKGEDAKTWISFRDENTTISLRKDAGTLPTPITKFFETASEKEETLNLTLNRESLEKALDMALLYHQRALSDSKPHHVKLTWKEGSVELGMDIPDLATFKEPLEIVSSSGNVDRYSINLNPKPLSALLAQISGPEIVLRFLSSKEPVMILDPEVPSFQALQVPLIVKA